VNEWIAAVLGTAPIEIDRAAAALLRFCRDHAAALREARSAQVDRALAPATDALAAWLAEHVAGDWLLPSRLAAPIAALWRHAHDEVSPAPARVAVARAVAEALDEGLGHRFVSLFRRRGVWSVAPGEAFPVVQPDLRKLFDAPLTTLPDRREAPIDRTRRLAIAPAADGLVIALDLSRAALATPPAGDARVVVALPIGAPRRELDWTERRGDRPVFHDVRPVASTDVAARVTALVAEACALEATILVFPELSVDERALDAIRAALADAATPPALVFAGSRHVVAAGARHNLATMIAGAIEVTHTKFNPYFAGEQLEDIALVPAEVRAHGLVDDLGRLAFAITLLVCKDFVAPGAQHALEALRPSLVVVPAWSQKTSIFESDAMGLTGKTQAIVVIANQADESALGEEDPAILILTRPVPSLSPVIVRRSEVVPPVLVTAALGVE